MSIISGVGASPSVGPTSGGKVYAYNTINTIPQVVAPASPARTKITFHNPGTVDLIVGPSFVQTTGSNTALTPNASALGGCWRVFGNGGTLVIDGECQGAWQCFSIIGAANPLTVVDTNI